MPEHARRLLRKDRTRVANAIFPSLQVPKSCIYKECYTLKTNWTPVVDLQTAHSAERNRQNGKTSDVSNLKTSACRASYDCTCTLPPHEMSFNYAHQVDTHHQVPWLSRASTSPAETACPSQAAVSHQRPPSIPVCPVVPATSLLCPQTWAALVPAQAQVDRRGTQPSWCSHQLGEGQASEPLWRNVC